MATTSKTITCKVKDPISPAKAANGKDGTTPTGKGTAGTNGASHYDGKSCTWKCDQQPTNGKTGLPGGDGTSGTPGQHGQHGPIVQINVDVLEGHVTLLVGAQSGQAGGDGGNGGNGGPGGDAGVDPNAGNACKIAQNGDQGVGGNGGDGGDGGNGGNGAMVYLYYRQM